MLKVLSQFLCPAYEYKRNRKGAERWLRKIIYFKISGSEKKWNFDKIRRSKQKLKLNNKKKLSQPRYMLLAMFSEKIVAHCQIWKSNKCMRCKYTHSNSLWRVISAIESVFWARAHGFVRNLVRCTPYIHVKRSNFGASYTL